MLKRYALLALSALLLGGLLSAQEPVKIADFSTGLDGWTFSLGKEFPGAEGNLYYEAEAKCAVMDGFFGRGGNYVGMYRGFPKPLDLKSITIRCSAAGLDGVMLRVVDSSNQTFQQPLSMKNLKDGVLKVEKLAGAPKGFAWGGAKDGKWHGPAKGMSLLIDRAFLSDKESGKGSLLITSIEGDVAGTP